MENTPFPFYTPRSEDGLTRLKIPTKDITVISGSLHVRGKGTKAVIEIKGERYKVIGRSCGAPYCECDAQLKRINKNK